MTEAQGGKSTRKKEYNTPVLQVYGDLKVLTQNFTIGMGAGDGDGMNPNHFNTGA